jgi:hypothetical protein
VENIAPTRYCSSQNTISKEKSGPFRDFFSNRSGRAGEFPGGIRFQKAGRSFFSSISREMFGKAAPGKARPDGNDLKIPGGFWRKFLKYFQNWHFLGQPVS